MVVRAVIGVLWLIAIVLFVAAMRLPRMLDIYIKDYYVAVAGWWFIVGILLVLMIPLLVTTAKLFRSVLRPLFRVVQPELRRRMKAARLDDLRQVLHRHAVALRCEVAVEVILETHAWTRAPGTLDVTQS
jgi:hypothetical protein